MTKPVISLAEAVEKGLVRYFTGQACPRGHKSERFVKSRICCECARENYRAFYQRNQEKLAAKRAADRQRAPDYFREYYSLNREGRKRESKDWYGANKDRASRLHKLWCQANPDKVREISRLSARNRRGRKAEAGGSHTQADLDRIYRQQRGKCALCKCALSRARPEVDHITPLALGGHNSASNLQFLCRPCNRAKHAKDPILYAQEVGLLL